MKVTVITPSYNCKKFIRLTIESVKNQVFEGSIEHIVVDGGSTDGTVELLSSYPHLKWISEPDMGMYDAINKGIKLASGEIIAYLNADDRYFPRTINIVANAFIMDAGLDFVYGYCEYINDRERPLFTLRPLPFALAKHSPRILWPQQTFFWRERVHCELGLFDTSLKYCGDTDFMSRVLLSGKRGMLIRHRLARFMLRSDCITVNGSEKLIEERKIIKKRHLSKRTTLLEYALEIVFALQNFRTFPARISFRRLIRRRRQEKRNAALG